MGSEQPFRAPSTVRDLSPYNCPDWLNPGLADATCNAGAGAEGGAGTQPALVRLRERRGGIHGKTRDLIFCRGTPPILAPTARNAS